MHGMGRVIGTDTLVTSCYVFYKSNTAFDTIVDVAVIRNPASDNFFLMSYSLYGQLLLDNRLD